MTHFIAVIDIGKTNAKVAILDSDQCCEVAVRTMPNKVSALPPYPHYDIDSIWKFICTSMSALNHNFLVSAISITTHGACAVLLDKQGKLAMPVLDYEHDCLDKFAEQYDLIRPDFAETGSPPLAKGLNLGAQIFWQMSNFPEAAATVSQILTYPQYWAFRLTGVASSEVTSLGCHTDLWNPWINDFSSLVHDQNWTELMAPICKANDILGQITEDFATQTGLSKNTPVACGIHDSNASLYSHLVNRPAPFSVVSSGTWTICMAVGGKNIKPDPARDTLVNVNALGDPVPSARFMGGREFDVLMEGRESGFTIRDITHVLKNNIMISPAVEKEFGPFQGRQMEWYGGQPESDGAYYVAVSFYLALMTATCLSLIGAQGPTIVEGPFAKNEAYLEMLAAATEKPIAVSKGSATGTSVGAAMLVKNSEHSTQYSAERSDLVFEYNPQSRLVSYAKIWSELVRQ